LVPQATALTYDVHQQHQHQHQHQQHRACAPSRPSPTWSGPTGLAGSGADTGGRNLGRLAGASDPGSPAPSAAQDEGQIPDPYVPSVTEPSQSSPAPHVAPPRAPATAWPHRTMRVLPFGLGLGLIGLGVAVIGLGLRRR
jgi:hypothetical protein